MTPDFQPHLRVAEQAALEAGAILLDRYGRVAAREKKPGDLVTEADTASQARIAAILAEAFPDHTLLAEEEGVTPDSLNPWRWIVDPLDGTINFAHGFPFWCVSIGLSYAGRLVVGVIHDPLAERTFAARLDGGATVNGRAMSVSAAGSLRESLISTGLPTDFASDRDRQLALMARMSTGTHSVRRTGSTALNLALVAMGGLDVFYATSIHPWDMAAGIVLVREAGGTVSSLRGGPHDLDRGDVLATNGVVHAEVAAALAEAWPGG